MPNEKLSRYFFLAVLIGTSVVLFRMLQAFLIPVLLAAVFATLFHPFYERLVRLFRGRRSLASFVCCFILLLGLVAPLYGVADMVTREAITFYQQAEAWVSAELERGDQGLIGRARRLPLVSQLRLDQVDWPTALQEAATSAGSFVATLINKTSRGTIHILIVLFTTLFTMFYFFRDGRSLVQRLRYLIPLDREYKNAIAKRFSSVARATVKGTLLIALVQGTLAGITLWIFGVGSPILWGVVATLLSIIPLVGAWLVLYPAAFFQMITGDVWQGVGILIVTVVVIVNADNLLRPRLVGQETGMHDLMVFFSTLGGIAMFGPMGFIIGPMIAALFLSLLDIYSAEFKDNLEATGTAGQAALPQLEPPEAREEPVPDPSPGVPAPSPAVNPPRKRWRKK